MADNLTISIGADSARLRAELAVAQSSMRAFTREMNSAANAARKSSGDLSFAKAAQAAANVNRLTAEISHLKTELGEAGVAVRGMEAIGEGAEKALTAVTSMRGAFREMGEAVGIALAVEKLREWVSEAARGAEETRNFAAAIGITASRYSDLQGAMKLAGGDAETMARALTIVQQRAEEALRSGGGKAYDAFRAMGLSPDDMKRSADELVTMMAGAWQRMGAIPARTTAFADVLGRQFANMVHLLDGGTAHLGELVQQARAFGLALGDPALGTLSRIADSSHELSGAWEGLKNTVATTFSGEIVSQIDALTHATEGWTAAIKAGFVPPASSGYDSYRQNAGAFISGTGDLAIPPETYGLTTDAPASRITPMQRLRQLRGETLLPGGMQGGAAAMRDWLAAQGYSPGAAAGIMGNASVESGFDPAAGLGTAHQGLFSWDKNRWAGGDFEDQMQHMDGELSRRDPAFKTATGSPAALAARFESVFENSGGQMLGERMARADSYGQSFFPAGGTKPDWEAANKAMLADFDRRIAEAREKASAGGGQQSVDALQRILDDKAKYQALRGGDRDNYLQDHPLDQSAEELKTASSTQREINALKLQYYDADTRNKVASLKEQQAATQDFAKKIALQQQVIATLRDRQHDRPLGPGIGDNAGEEATRQMAALRRQQSVQGFQGAEQDYGSLRQRDQLQLRGAAAQEGAAVDAHHETQAQAIQKEIALTQQYAAGEMAALQHLKDMAAASGNKAEEDKVGNQILEQQVSTMTTLLGLQKKLADEAKKTADAWAQPLKAAFDQIGSGVEGAAKSLILARNSQQRGAAWQGLYKSEIGAGVDLVGGVASKVAAQPLAGVLGTSYKSGEGSGEVVETFLSQLVTQTLSQLGLLTTIAANTSVSAAASTTGATTSGLSAAGSAGGILGGISTAVGWVGGLFGGGASAAAPMITAAAMLSKGGRIPAASRGWTIPGAAAGWSLPASFGSDRTLIAGTPGETVLPLGEHPSQIAATLGRKIDGLAAAGGGDQHFHIGAGATIFDGPSFARYLQREGKDTIMSMFKQAARGPAANFT